MVLKFIKLSTMDTPVKCLLMAMLWQVVLSQEGSTTSRPGEKRCYTLRGRTCEEVFWVIIGITFAFIGAVSFAYCIYFITVVLYVGGPPYLLRWLKALCCCSEAIEDINGPHQIIVENMEEEDSREEVGNALDPEVHRDHLSGASDRGASKDAVKADQEAKAVKEAREAVGKREGVEGHDQGSATKKVKLDREPFSMPSSPTGTRINPEVISSTPNKPSRNEGYNFQKAEEKFNPRNLESVEAKGEPVCSDNCNGGVMTEERSGPMSPKVELPRSSPDYIVLPENATPAVEEVDPSTPAVHPEVAEADPESLPSLVTIAEAPSDVVEHSDSSFSRYDPPSGGTLDKVAEPVSGEAEGKKLNHSNVQEGHGSSGSSFEKINSEFAEAEGTSSDHTSDEENSKSEIVKTLEEANFTAHSSSSSHNAVSEITETSFQSIASGSQKSGAQGNSSREDRRSESKNVSFLKSFVDRSSGSDEN